MRKLTQKELLKDSFGSFLKKTAKSTLKSVAPETYDVLKKTKSGVQELKKSVTKDVKNKLKPKTFAKGDKVAWVNSKGEENAGTVIATLDNGNISIKKRNVAGDFAVDASKLTKI